MGKNKKYVLWMIDLAKLLAVVGGATLLGLLFVKSGFPETNIVVIYIFAVLLVARFTTGYFCGILSSVVSLLCFNYFFTAPYHTLAVNDPSYMIMRHADHGTDHQRTHHKGKADDNGSYQKRRGESDTLHAFQQAF